MKALVTGASSGIGREIALHLANDYEICINFSKSRDRAERVKDEIEEMGGQAVIFKADVSKEKEVKEMFEFLSREFGNLDVLVNNAGIDIPELIEEHSCESWHRVIDVNLTGKFLCTKHAVPLLKKSESPVIINTASRFGTKPLQEVSAYCCAEAGIIMLTRVAALELSKYNIRVNAVSPGLTRTPLTKKICTQEEFDNYKKTNPRKRLGKPVDIANAVMFLVSKEADFINGENINVSGGILLK